MQSNLVAELTLDEIDAVSGAGFLGRFVGNALQTAVDVSNGVLNGVGPIGVALNNLVPGYSVAHQAGDALINAGQNALNSLGSHLGGTHQPVNPGHYQQEWQGA